MKLLIVGLDGADYEWCSKFMSVMPCLARMKATGVFARLESYDPPSTPPCWFSAITGALPEEHGIRGFRMKAMKDVQRPPFWKFLDCPVGIVNIPLVYWDGDEFDGFLVPGFHAPMRPYPPGLPLDGYVVASEAVTQGRLTWLGSTMNLSFAEIARRQTAFLYGNYKTEKARIYLVEKLLGEFNVEVLFVGLMLIDRIGHGFAHHKQTMRYVYRLADSFIGRLMKCADPETVVVFSDHGMDEADSPRISPKLLEADKRRREKNPPHVLLRGHHTQDGIFAAAGRFISHSAKVEEARLENVAPTILAIMGKQKPGTMSGTALDIFPADEDPRTVEMLRGLGYL